MLLRKGFPGGSEGKETSCNAGDPGSIPRLGRSPEEGNCTPIFLPGESHGTEETGRLQSMGLQRVDTNEQITHMLLIFWKGNVYCKLLILIMLHNLKNDRMISVHF